MEKLCDKLIKLLEKPEEYLRASDKLQTWIEQTKNVYNFVKAEEEKYSLPTCAESLHQLTTDGLDTEQIWQLLELQNKNLLAAPDDLDGLDDVNLCFSVAKLISLANYNKLLPLEEEEEGKGLIGDQDSLLGKSSDEEEDEMDEEEEEEQDDDDDDEGVGSLENLKDDEEELGHSESLKDDESSDSSDDELYKDPSQIDEDLNLDFDDDSDNEEDNFDELIAPEGMEDTDDDDDTKPLKDERVKASDDEKEEMEINEMNNTDKKSRRFGKSEVDSKFFNLRESEWVADHDAIGENYDMDTDDIDYMKDLSGDEEDKSDLMHDAFFGDKKAGGILKKPTIEDDSVKKQEGEPEATPLLWLMKKPLQNDEGDGEVTQLLGLKKKEQKSTFEKDRERELTLMSTLEEDNITEKPWHLRGEVVSADRPENSTLEEQLDCNIAATQRPVITEDTTTLVEKIILNRIQSKAWDDVIRKVKPDINPFEYKKKLLLDQEKSKKSLAEIYEEEYLKQQKQVNDSKEEEELPEHKEIKTKMDDLFTLLDALANYHYTPKQAKPEVKIQSNLPAITMEEATPATATDATLLAPQEIHAPVRGELLGETERTATDKKRDRRAKKAHQKSKAKMQERKLQEKLQKVGGKKKLDNKTTRNFIEKAIKAGQVKVLEEQHHKSVKSSQTFFKELQNASTSKKEGLGKKKKDTGKLSASKLLL